MPIEEEFKSNNLLMQNKVKEEIEMVRNGVSNKNINQLNKILDELIKMANEKQLSVNFPRFIVDSWDFQDKLGIELMDIAALYKKLKW